MAELEEQYTANSPAKCCDPPVRKCGDCWKNGLLTAEAKVKVEADLSRKASNERAGNLSLLNTWLSLAGMWSAGHLSS